MSDFMCAGTFLQQTGWRRPYPLTICQDSDVLLRITEFDFDLNDAQFRNYIAARGVMTFKYIENSSLQHYIEVLTVWDEVQTLAYYKDDKTMLKIWKITKAKIQDCWEIYNDPVAKEMTQKQKEEEWSEGDTF